VRILVAGGSGFLGTALRAHLALEGHFVTQLVRSEPSTPTQVRWDPDRGDITASVVDEADAVVNLAGAPLAHWPWTAAYRKQIIESRVATTNTLAEAIAATGGSTALVNASGINYYGSDRGDENLDESSAPGDDFIAEVSKRWESATAAAANAGARVGVLRTSVVLDSSGGALKSLLLPFRLGVGGRLGTGRQWFATVSLDDYLRAVTRIATDDTMSGPYNIVAPVAATNAQFTAALGQRLHRPTLLTVPSFGLKAALPGLSTSLLGGVKAAPQRLMEAGFEFSHPTISAQLDAALA